MQPSKNRQGIARDGKYEDEPHWVPKPELDRLPNGVAGGDGDAGRGGVRDDGESGGLIRFGKYRGAAGGGVFRAERRRGWGTGVPGLCHVGG